jgi:preprotein translocase SecE subunit
VARNRKRAKERRARRPQPVPAREEAAAPEPIRHAAPDVELAEAQLALGRPELIADGEPEPDDEELFEEEAAEEARAAGQPSGNGPTSRGGGAVAVSGAAGSAAVAAQRASIGTRLIHFLQGSWRELQRVQWPDRRQVMQATGVVIGFVIVAGVFLGVADFVSQKIVTFILK